MLDLKLLRDQPERVKEKLSQRRAEVDLEQILGLDAQRRQLETQRTILQTDSNSIGKQVGEAIRKGSDPHGSEVASLRERGTRLKDEISRLEIQEKDLAQKVQDQLLTIPNLPQDEVPVGFSEEENPETRHWGDDFKPGFSVLAHDDMAIQLGILEVERAVKIAQSRFISLMGDGAALERSLITLMLNRHVGAGYTEVMPPLLVNSNSLQGTGQLPKFAEDGFRCAEDDLWLIPTAEVPLTNLHQGEVLSTDTLPIKYCAFTPCFRREAGSYGRDTKGLIRLHQFNKVELVKLCRPDQSEAELQALVGDAAAILELLELPYRIVEHCTGDLGFSAARSYDLEVWMPSQNRYREISSCSNCRDFQARRANIRCKEPGQKGTQYVHTLNGSGLAVGRTMAAILENYQQPDGSLRIPRVLQPLLGKTILTPPEASKSRGV